MQKAAHKLADEFIVIEPGLSAKLEAVSPDLYARLDQQFNGFQGCILVAEHSFEQDWENWECHPAGDEILYLLAGSASIHLLRDGQNEIIRFDQTGSSLIIPRGIWHTAKIHTPCRMLFLTPGAGTLISPDPSQIS